jgi:hypothetical protein
MSLSAFRWQRLLTVKILQLHALKSSLHSLPYRTAWTTQVTVKVKVTLRPTVSQSVGLGVEHHLGLMTRYLLFFDSYGLTRGWVFFICCWPSPAQYFSGPSPWGLGTIFYCLRIETSLFVASYDSQGHGGGIRLRLHTGCLSNWVWVWVLYYDPWSVVQSVLE